MKVVRTIPELKAIMREVRGEGKVVGLVPTMGYLHQGHLSLVREARRDCGFVVVSIYVNPIQFGAGEDFSDYPRDLGEDTTRCRGEGVDLVFAPSDREMYPRGYATYVEVEGLTRGLCGRGRPGHFRGVATVVTKLFNLVRPHRAYFGQKDAQQALVLRKMVKDLDMDLRLEIVPTVREEGGLALSSRNAYLTPREKEAALVLYRALCRGRDLVRGGVRRAGEVIQALEEIIRQESLARVEYIEIVDLETLGGLEEIQDRALIALAARVGKTRLIDNLIVEV